MGGIGRASDMAAAAVALTCCRAVPDGLKWPLSRALDEKRRDVWFGVIRGGRFLSVGRDPILDHAALILFRAKPSCRIFLN